MEYSKSLLRQGNYLLEQEEENSIIYKWMKYKKSDKLMDLDLSCKEFYQQFWPEIVNNICPCGDTMTSVLVTFEEFAYHYGFIWKTKKRHGKNTFLEYFEQNDYQKLNELEKLPNYDTLVKYIELATSCCNMIPVPAFFNAGRSGPYAKWDYWDLTLLQIYKWYMARKQNNFELQMDALRLLFSHSTHNNIFRLRSTNMFDSICSTWKWLDVFATWENFVTIYCLDDFVNKNQEWKPKLFWTKHSFELPLPTDTSFSNDCEKRRKQIDNNFNEFFANVIAMLEGRAKLLLTKQIS